MRYRITAGTVMTLDPAGTIHRPGQVSWENGTIVSVGTAESDRRPVDQTIHVPAGVVMPGFYNGHNHAAMTLFRGLADDSPLFEWLQQHIWPREARLTADDIYAGTMLAAAEMIRSGTVGFADMYFEMDAVAQAVADSGLRGWLARGLIGTQDPDGEKLAESVEFARRWADQADGRIVPMLAPHAPYTCPPPYLAQVAEAARKHNLGIHIHLAESHQELADITRQYGRTPIELASDTGIFRNRTLIAHGVHILESDLPALAGLVGGVIACPVSNAKLASGILPYRLLRDAGVPIGLGTDGAASTNTLDMFQEMKAMAWLQKLRDGQPDGFRAVDALRAATRGTAAVLGFPGGELTTGSPADLIVVDGRQAHLMPEWDVTANLVYAGVGSDVVYTVVAGRILMAEGIIQSFDEQAIMRDVVSRVAHLTD
ncbi:MAG: amidohydrolase [Thermaerobacter sp.]|nr:amidohydrolase [Thermaerobacter sp.]